MEDVQDLEPMKH